MSDVTGDDVKRRSEESGKILALVTALAPNLSTCTDAQKLDALRMLINSLETAVGLSYAYHYEGAAEPFPGALKEVLRQALMAVELSRSSGLVGPAAMSGDNPTK